MTEDQKAKLWALKMQLAREMANLYQVRMRIECVTWRLADGAMKREYILRRTGQQLWSRRADRPLP